MLTHRNLLHNLATIREVWHDGDDTIGVYWLPPHHDMGLIGVILERLYAGCTTVLMSPTGFIKNPMRWLEAMSRHRATVTTAPNFAYEACVERSTAEERAALDLSNWTTAMCGAEPIRAATLRAFAEAFAPAGFRPEAFHPVYGLAEATLLVSGGSNAAGLAVQRIDRTALSEDRVVDAAPGDSSAATLVGCGRPLGGQQVIIVDPETCRRCEPDRVGEIWIAGPSVAPGYWGRPEETKQTFSAFLAEAGPDAGGPFLRTGDLGFLRDGELFITGRWKDLVVIRRGNYYPNDIEATVQDCHPALVSGRGAVFSVASESGGAEQLVVVQELDRGRAGQVELMDLVDTIRAAVTEHHGLQADAVLLVDPLRLPTTTSGKIQRGLCRQQFVDRELGGAVEWYAPLPPAADAVDILAKARTDPEVAARLAALAKLTAADTEGTT
jgi:acyl-CoA synthetase (AMP-forming)/AMP-acid ligase II